MLFAFYATNDQKTIRVWCREWRGHIVFRDDGRCSPQSNLNLCFDTMQEAAEAELWAHANAGSHAAVHCTTLPEISRKPVGKEVRGDDSAKRARPGWGRRRPVLFIQRLRQLVQPLVGLFLRH